MVQLRTDGVRFTADWEVVGKRCVVNPECSPLVVIEEPLPPDFYADQCAPQGTLLLPGTLYLSLAGHNDTGILGNVPYGTSFALNIWKNQSYAVLHRPDLDGTIIINTPGGPVPEYVYVYTIRNRVDLHSIAPETGGFNSTDLHGALIGESSTAFFDYGLPGDPANTCKFKLSLYLDVYVQVGCSSGVSVSARGNVVSNFIGPQSVEYCRPAPARLDAISLGTRFSWGIYQAGVAENRNSPAFSPVGTYSPFDVDYSPQFQIVTPGMTAEITG